MDTNREEPGDDDKLLFRAEVFQIVGCAIEVLNTLGHGLIEKAVRKRLGRRVWSEKHSVSATTGLRRPL